MSRLRRLLGLACIALALGACERGGPAQEGDQAYADKMSKAHAGDAPVPSPATAERPALEVTSQSVKYATIDSRETLGYLAYPVEAHGALPGILVFHEWWGLNDNVRAMADRLAGQGYVVLAADLYGGATAEDPAAARALMEKALGDTAAIGQNIRGALQFLEEQTQASGIATLGWCFGGGMSLEAALLMPDKVAATVIYYGHVTTDRAELGRLKMPVLGIFGAEDDSIPVEHVRSFERTLHELGKDAEIHVYPGAGHAFANPSGRSYRAESAADAWDRTLEFLDKHLNKAMYEAPAP